MRSVLLLREKVIVIILTGHGELERLRAIMVSAIVCHNCGCCSHVSTALGQENFFIVTLGNRFYLFAVSQMTVTNTIDTEYACSNLTWVLCSSLWTCNVGSCYSACSWHGSLDSCLMSVCSAAATWGVHTARVSGQHHRHKRTKTFCSSCWKGICLFVHFSNVKIVQVKTWENWVNLPYVKMCIKTQICLIITEQGQLPQTESVHLTSYVLCRTVQKAFQYETIYI